MRRKDSIGNFKWLSGAVHRVKCGMWCDEMENVTAAALAWNRRAPISERSFDQVNRLIISAIDAITTMPPLVIDRPSAACRGGGQFASPSLGVKVRLLSRYRVGYDNFIGFRYPFSRPEEVGSSLRAAHSVLPVLIVAHRPDDLRTIPNSARSASPSTGIA